MFNFTLILFFFAWTLYTLISSSLSQLDYFDLQMIQSLWTFIVYLPIYIHSFAHQNPEKHMKTKNVEHHLKSKLMFVFFPPITLSLSHSVSLFLSLFLSFTLSFSLVNFGGEYWYHINTPAHNTYFRSSNFSMGRMRIACDTWSFINIYFLFAEFPVLNELEFGKSIWKYTNENYENL